MDNNNDDLITVTTTNSEMAELAKQWKLCSSLTKQLESANVDKFFAIQKSAIPPLLNPHVEVDMCVAAPTGSGKTLCYVLPIIQRLVKRIVPRVRALVVVPSRDLAIQVKRVVDHYAKGTTLKCGLAIGQVNFASEQLAIVGKSGSTLTQILDEEDSCLTDSDDDSESLVDIIVATPGRLVDHLEQTPGFTLEHLQFLVVDEADRLLDQSYHEWLSKVYNSVYNSDKTNNTPRTIRSLRAGSNSSSSVLYTPLQRIILSATLTSNPKWLASLGLKKPIFISMTRPMNSSSTSSTEGEEQVEEGSVVATTDSVDDSEIVYSTSERLTEKYVDCSTIDKPLALLATLEALPTALPTIVFTASLQSTHRLTRLLQLHFEQSEDRNSRATPRRVVKEFSSTLTQNQRSKLLSTCRADDNAVNIIVSSDAMARGMDIPSVAYVINYDIPSCITTYIHRVGRTARAGRDGTCLTLVKAGQLRGLFRLLRKATTNQMLQLELEPKTLSELSPKYKKCLRTLKQVLAMENRGEMSSSVSLSKKLLEKLRNPAEKRAATESSSIECKKPRV